MKRFVEGVSRDQSTLFPERLEDFIGEDNPVRVIDEFVASLDLGELDFEGVAPCATGRPAYHPSVLLKLYIYGYLNRIHSSRRLERETQRNVELMWLCERLSPDFKTIADFRKDNGKAIRGVCREFVLLCRHLDLFTQAIVAIDGSKFKAVNHRDRNFTPAKMRRRLEQLEASIDRYLGQLDRADQGGPGVTETNTERLKEKVAVMKEEMQRLRTIQTRMTEAPDKQVSLTDPDARSMKTRGQGIVGYNVQTAVDPKHHLIVDHEVINTGIDRHQLSTMAKRARELMGADDLTVIADRGYYKSDELLACEEAGIAAVVPKSKTSNNEARGLFGRDAFRYVAETDEYLCPAGKRAIWRFRTVEGGRTLDCYWSSACSTCSIKSQCTTGVQRRIKRWIHESVLDRVQARLDRKPETMQLRRQTVEHPFATLKTWMGYTHFLTRKLPNVRTEMSLHVLAYNLKRVINLMGVGALREALAP
jgi:transposase